MGLADFVQRSRARYLFPLRGQGIASPNASIIAMRADSGRHRKSCCLETPSPRAAATAALDRPQATRAAPRSQTVRALAIGSAVDFI